MSGWSLTRANVQAWNTGALGDLATAVGTRNGLYETEIGTPPRHLGDLGDRWTGRARDAASDRVAQDALQARKVKEEVADFGTVLSDAGGRLFWERDTLLRKVADAEDGAGAIAGETLKVADDWAVQVTWPAGVTADERSKILDRARGHQDLINAAWIQLRDAAHQVDRLIRAAAQQVRDAGSNFGDGLDVPVTAGTRDTRAELSGRDGTEDGATIADGKLSADESDRITERLLRAQLTPEQLAAMADGQDITVPQSTMDYLTNLYREAGRDGLLVLSHKLDGSGAPGAQALRGSLGNGMMMLSNEHVVVRDSQGRVTDKGSYDKLAPEVRELIGTRPAFGTGAPDANTRDVPDDYRPGLFTSKDRHGALEEYTRDISRLANFIDNADPRYIPGQRLGVELTRQSAHQAWLLENGAYTHYEGHSEDSSYFSRLTEASAHDFLDAGTRNRDSNYALLTGNGDDELFGKGVPGQTFDGYHRNDVIAPLLRHEWNDDGKALSGLYNWIGQDANVTDPGNPAQIARAEHAGQAAFGLSQILTDSKLYDTFMNVPGHHNASIGELNPVAVQKLSTALAPFIGNMAGADPEFLSTRGYGNTDNASATHIFSIMNSNDVASRDFNAHAYIAIAELEYKFAEVTMDDPGNPRIDIGAAAGRIQGMVESGYALEAHDRQDDANSAAKDGSDHRKDVFDSARALIKNGVTYLPLGPLEPAGKFSSGLIDLFTNPIDQTLIGSADPVSPRSGNAEQQVDAHQSYNIVRALQAQGPLHPDPYLARYLDSDGKLLGWDDAIRVDNPTGDPRLGRDKLGGVTEGYLDKQGFPIARFLRAISNGRQEVLSPQ
ncbi:hypothetical protein ACFVUS_08475 [Nocardia sp. NPDC058058]|uniref:TPR repeat region-containing protein n=1 Tax=Nocardia sp. NPDC058058 TaxID=3346317 RepID=UPI0036D9E498